MASVTVEAKKTLTATEATMSTGSAPVAVDTTRGSATADTATLTKLAIIGGSSFLSSSAVSALQVVTVSTTHGDVLVRVNADQSLLFVQRHAANPAHAYSPPHLINKKAIAVALKQLGATHVVAFGSVGTLKKSLPLGALVVPDDFYAPASPITLFEHDHHGHVMPGFNAKLRSELLTLLAPFSPVTTGVYGQTNGPRFETPSEIRQLGQWADVVGMTCAHEAVLFQELGLPYALICMVDNIANGLDVKPLTSEAFYAGVKRNLVVMETVLRTVIAHFLDAASPLSPSSASSTSDELKSPTTTTGAGAARTRVDLIVHALAIVPMQHASADAGSLVLDNHSLVVDKGVIVALLPHSEAEAKYQATEVVDQREHGVLMPGMVNMHTHLGMTLLRGFSDDVCLIDWLKDHIWPAEGRFVTPEFVRDGSELGIAEMIKGGTTCFNDMYFFAEEMCAMIEKSGVRGMVGHTILDFPTPYATNAEDYIQKGLALRARYSDHPRIQFCFAPHAPYSVSEDIWIRVQKLALEHKSAIHTHLHETAEEVRESTLGIDGFARHKSEQKCAPLDNFQRLDLVNSRLVAAHMTQLTDGQIKSLSEAKAHVVHCPSSNMKLAAGFCPVHKLNQAGVNVCLGTDSSASNNKLDMMQEIRMACLLAKGVARDASAVPAYQALRMATINGARALGIDSKVGSLEVGKSADFIAVNMDAMELLPLFDIISHLVYCISRERVSDVWVCGARLLRGGALVTLSEVDIVRRTRAWNARLLDFRRENDAAIKKAAAMAAAGSPTA